MKRCLFFAGLLGLSLCLSGCTIKTYCHIISTLTSFQYTPSVCVKEIDKNKRRTVPQSVRHVVRRSMVCNYIPSFTCTNPENEPGFCENLLVDGSFEQGTYRAGSRPVDEGFWQGDLAEVVTESDTSAASQGLRPCDGIGMLRFLGSGPGGATASGISAVFQLVDMSDYRSVIQAGGVKVVARVLFDRIQRDAETDRQFSLGVAALEGSLANFPTQWADRAWLDLARMTIQTDNVRGWQEVVAELELPANTDYIVVSYSADENVAVDLVAPEYDGHFADDVQAQLSR